MSDLIENLDDIVYAMRLLFGNISFRHWLQPETSLSITKFIDAPRMSDMSYAEDRDNYHFFSTGAGTFSSVAWSARVHLKMFYLAFQW